MSNEEAKDVTNQEIVKPEANIQGQEDHSAQVKSPNDNNPIEGSKEYNFAKIRQKNEELERRVNELMKKEMERNAPPSKEEDETSSLSDDDILTVAQARKLAEKQAMEIFKKAMAENEKAKLPQLTKSKFSDFDSVLTEENIRKLETEEPELADACSKSANPWEATYKILKKFVLPQQDAKTSKSDEKMKENLSKPLSSNAVGRGPLSTANVWAEASKEDLYKEMMDAARLG